MNMCEVPGNVLNTPIKGNIILCTFNLGCFLCSAKANVYVNADNSAAR